jgi:hypothetical protein
MKVSHEVPRCLLIHSREFNDYSYCLPHLLDLDEDYRNFFYEEKRLGRYIIMDNSLHELGEAYNHKRLLHWVNELEPNEFIVPDVWMDFSQTCAQAKHWRQFKYPKNTTLVAVVQGKDESDAYKCYRILKDLGYKKIAFSYGASWYNDLVPHPNKDFGKAMGRFMALSKMEEDAIINRHTMVHLLGTAWPAEFGMYRGFDFIESLDTSNPVMAAIDNLKYGDLGLDHKPVANMNNFQDIDKSLIYYGTLEHNIWKFREINGL